MGGLASLMEKMPSQIAAKAQGADLSKVERDMLRKQGIIHSMTPKERSKPELIKATRKRRIAGGAGVQVQDAPRGSGRLLSRTLRLAGSGAGIGPGAGHSAMAAWVL